jgi:hypothetical protein
MRQTKIEPPPYQPSTYTKPTFVSGKGNWTLLAALPGLSPLAGKRMTLPRPALLLPNSH